ncbi:MAG TPA: 5-deoxy-glucuronate isomerase [Micromonosporaceae bacterium]|jgi:5-deoxy-glucuronate isomerase
MSYRYHTTIATANGRNTLPANPCQLLDFTLLKLDAGANWSGESGDREILAVILGGRATFTVNGHVFTGIGERADVFSGKPHSVYIPAGATISVDALSSVEVAMPSAPSDLATQPYVIGPQLIEAGRWGAYNFARTYHRILTEVAQPELPARRLIVGETYTPSGNWSTYPPHRHAFDNLPAEAQHEEMYYYRINPTGGFGLSVVYTDDGEQEVVMVRDHAMQMMPSGYHTVVSAPGYTTYFLWFLAGTQRTQGALEDVNVAWVGQQVPTLRGLGL